MEEQDKKPSPGSSDEVALELMKFIATTTAYGRASQQQVGFSGKNARTPEEQALVDGWQNRSRTERPPKIKKGAANDQVPTSDDHGLWAARLAGAVGTAGDGVVGAGGAGSGQWL